MRRAGVEPAVLQPKDGLALISANGVSVGMGALVADRGATAAVAADLVLAVSLESVRGNPSIVDPHVARMKPIPGQRESIDTIRAFLDGSDLCVPGAAVSVQDPLSFRVAPQVHGAYREFARAFAEAVEMELASSDDNPLVVTAEHRLVSNGNFHPMVLALAADAFRSAIAQVGQLSSRRLAHLWAAVWQDPKLLEPAGMRTLAESGAALLMYAGAARYTDLRALADPATLDVPPLDLGVEDHATNAPVAVFRTDTAFDVLDDLMAIELLSAHETIRRRPDQIRTGAGVRAALAAIDDIRSELGSWPSSEVLHAAVRDALYARIVPAALNG
jgi:histidine ammonia-lyase